MMFHKMVRPTLAAAAALAVSLGFTACSRDYVAAYVYAPSNTTGSISAYGVDYQSGVLTQINGSPFPSQLTNPVTLVTHPNNKFLYLIGGTQNAEVEEFAIGTDGKLYGSNTYNITGTYPTAAAVDTTGKFLYVTYQYQKAYTPVSTGPGGLTIFPINSDGSLGTAVNMNLGMYPAAVAVSAITCAPNAALGSTNPACTGTYGSGHQNVFVYVVDQGDQTVVAFTQNVATGALTVAGSSTCAATTPSTCTGYAAGVTPSAIGVDPTGRFVYVTDKTSNEVIGYSSALTSNGALTPLTSSPYTTGSYPVGLTIDPRGDYLYTANYNGGSVSGFSINSSNGSLGTIASTSGFTTKTGPTCVTIEPALGIYLYTSNYLDGSISGGQLSANTGQLSGVVDSPFPTSTQPVCIASVANGSHASSLVNP
ncbi:6-phosphogluconolactonase, cycloisomerase 2 family [Bryocella elongata]|uniref:6-phosphogluconolactonase, cycloisomerase 2 family n=1 Tax=Bryocella elongata TaxID=863522 RepID=A0A1H6BP44_9BACT|nr:beta-propeller fold lactonase family protein [Bryocella elongata]SEG62177.1 6-phosphogluconolactonase, cycloisomerase 2 family [Bryocella elongata]